MVDTDQRELDLGKDEIYEAIKRLGVEGFKMLIMYQMSS